MNAETISIIVSVVAVGAAVGTLAMTGIRQVRQDMDRRFTELRDDMREDMRGVRHDVSEVRRDVNTLREAVGALKEAVGTLKEAVDFLKEEVGFLKEKVAALKERGGTAATK